MAIFAPAESLPSPATLFLFRVRVLFPRHHLNKAPTIFFQRGVLACLVRAVLDLVLEEVRQVHHRTEAIGKEYLQNDWSWFRVPALS